MRRQPRLEGWNPSEMGGESDNLSFWTRRSAAWQTLNSGYPQDKGDAKKSKRIVVKHLESEGPGSKLALACPEAAPPLHLPTPFCLEGQVGWVPTAEQTAKTSSTLPSKSWLLGSEQPGFKL